MVSADKSSLTFSPQVLLREDEGLFKFGADETQKKRRGGKKKSSTLHSRNSHDICFSSSKTKYVLCRWAALAAVSRKEAVKSVAFSGQRQVAQCPWFLLGSAVPAPDMPPVLGFCSPG